jgi:prephenate dehydrogenase
LLSKTVVFIQALNRLKNGIDSAHPLFGPELRALRKVKREYPETQYVFISERKSPLTTSTFGKMLTRAGENAGIELSIHPHMLGIQSLDQNEGIKEVHSIVALTIFGI